MNVVNGVVYAGSGDGNVYAFSLKHGREKAGGVSKRREMKMLG